MKTLINKFKNFIKILAVCFSVTALSVPVQAADKVISSAFSTATALNLLSGGKYLVKDILVISGTNVTTTVKFYDSTAATNYVKAAYTSLASYSTNYNVVFTNAGGLLITNTLTGIYTGTTSVSASTNELPAIVGPYVIPASSSRTISDVNVLPVKGLTLYSTGLGTVEVVYEQIAP